MTMKAKFLLPILAGVLLTGSAQAQYTDNNQTNTISGVASNWVDNGTYVVGSNWVYDALNILNGGVFSNGVGYIGYEATASNNSVLVSGTGSVWSNTSYLYIGNDGSGNSLTITNGGTVYNGYGFIGVLSDDNTALVSGSGSVWSNRNDLFVSDDGSSNVLTIASSGTVYNANSYIGYDSDPNTALPQTEPLPVTSAVLESES